MRRVASSLVVFLVACGKAMPNAGPVDAMSSGDASGADAASADGARDSSSEAGASEGKVEAGENDASGTDLYPAGADGSVYDANEMDTMVLDSGLADAPPQEDAVADGDADANDANDANDTNDAGPTGAGMNDANDAGPIDASANDSRAPTTADNPPIPTGYKILSQADVTPTMTAWATSILNDSTDYPLFATATQTFGTLMVLARVEWQPPDFQNAAVHRGVTLYEPL